MKKEQLVKLIKEAVRDELKTSLPKILSEIGMARKKSITETSNKIEKNKKVIKNTQSRDAVRQETKRYSKNEVLNKVLNETVGGIPQEKNKPNELTDFNGNQVDVEELPDHLSRALTRNYSDLLSAVNEKTKAR